MAEQEMSLSRRKEHAEEKVIESPENDSEPLDPREDKSYPFAVVLRLRVLQIVCGIAALVMGTVAIIEEKGKLNLGLGIPAGGATIIAAAASIHTSRGFEGYRPSTCMPGSSLRFLGPSVRIAVPLTILWGMACSFQAALIINVILTLLAKAQQPQKEVILLQDDEVATTGTVELTGDLAILALIELGLALLTILAVVLVLRIDCKFDPD